MQDWVMVTGEGIDEQGENTVARVRRRYAKQPENVQKAGKDRQKQAGEETPGTRGRKRELLKRDDNRKGEEAPSGWQGYAEDLETTGRRRRGVRIGRGRQRKGDRGVRVDGRRGRGRGSEKEGSNYEGGGGDASKERKRVALRKQEEEEKVPGGERATGEAGGYEARGEVTVAPRVRARKVWGTWVPRMQYEKGIGSSGVGEGHGEACHADSGTGEKMTSEEEVGIADTARSRCQGQEGSTDRGGGEHEYGGRQVAGVIRGDTRPSCRLGARGAEGRDRGKKMVRGDGSAGRETEAERGRWQRSHVTARRGSGRQTGKGRVPKCQRAREEHDEAGDSGEGDQKDEDGGEAQLFSQVQAPVSQPNDSQCIRPRKLGAQSAPARQAEHVCCNLLQERNSQIWYQAPQTDPFPLFNLLNFPALDSSDPAWERNSHHLQHPVNNFLRTRDDLYASR
ncbi:hypothetical protein EDB87DRAFT_1581938 [Lactarius vividus]|nr:hypothetical protein EDB87DRAFT_1581938 [Lactarius vividus]